MTNFDPKLSMENLLSTVQMAIHGPLEDPWMTIHTPSRPMDDDG